MADLLLDTTLTPEQTTYAKAVKTSGDTLLSLIEEILDFSKIEAGRLDLEARPSTAGAGRGDGRTDGAARAGEGPRDRVPMSRTACPTASSATPRGCARCCSISPATRSSSPKTAALRSSSSAAQARRDRLPGARHRHRHRAAEQQERIFREFEQADGGPQSRRRGPRPRHFPAHRRAHGRPHCGRKRARRRRDLFAFSVAARRLADAAAALRHARSVATAPVMIVAPAAIEATLLARRLTRWGARRAIAPDETVAPALLPERALERDLDRSRLGPKRRNAARGDPLRTVPARYHDAFRPQRAAGPEDPGFTGYLIKPVRAASLAARLPLETDRAGGSRADGR